MFIFTSFIHSHTLHTFILFLYCEMLIKLISNKYNKIIIQAKQANLLINQSSNVCFYFFWRKNDLDLFRLQYIKSMVEEAYKMNFIRSLMFVFAYFMSSNFIVRTSNESAWMLLLSILLSSFQLILLYHLPFPKGKYSFYSVFMIDMFQ